MPKKPQEITMQGEVLDSATHKLSHGGNNDHVNIPHGWKKYFCSPLLEINLVKEENGELCLVITKIKKEATA